jgi:hypothetical protein
MMLIRIVVDAEICLVDVVVFFVLLVALLLVAVAVVARLGIRV